MKIALVLFAATLALVSAAPKEAENPLGDLLGKIQFPDFSKLNISDPQAIAANIKTNFDKVGGDLQSYFATATEEFNKKYPDVQKTFEDAKTKLTKAAEDAGLKDSAEQLKKAFDEGLKNLNEQVNKAVGTTKTT